MIATVLVGSGKPKIVQIQRPLSRRRESAPTPEIPQGPSTPVQATIEVSAFSPYDTPGEVAEMTQPTSLTPTAPTLSDEIIPHSSRQLSPVAASLCYQKRTPISHRSSQGVCDVASQMSPTLADPFTMSARRSTSSDSSKYNPGRPARDDPHVLHSLSPVSPTQEVATRSSCRKMERVLKAVAQAIFDFPNGMLRLDSSSVLEIRFPEVPDQTYIDTLGKIFPTAPNMLLSSLVAWILLDIYFTQLEDASESSLWRGTGEVYPHGNMHRIPAKARAMLGLDHTEVQPVCLTVHSLANRARAVHAGMGVVSRRLIEALRGSWDEDIWRSLKVLVEVIESGRQPF